MRKRDLAALLVEKSGLGAAIRTFRSWQGILALCYHRVGDNPSAWRDRSVWSTTTAGFKGQIQFLKKHFDVIGPDDLPAIVSRRRGRYVLITFDDGYRDNYTEAFPILRSLGVGATFFVTTGFLDNPTISPWDEIAWMVRSCRSSEVPAGPWLSTPVILDEPERDVAVYFLRTRYTSLPGDQTAAYLDNLAEATGSGRFQATDVAETWMTWDMLREMKAAGMWIGGHTVNHPVLSRISREKQLQEISDCGRRIREELGKPMTCFSYPVGNRQAFSAETQSCLQQAGVSFGFSYYGGLNRFHGWNPYDIRRASVDPEHDPARFRALVTLPQVFARFR
jgi:peptidoglycan/xylan/chitin deacetylase (PgdA/CDA1 family)